MTTLTSTASCLTATVHVVAREYLMHSPGCAVFGSPSSPCDCAGPWALDAPCGSDVVAGIGVPCARPRGHDGHHASAARLAIDAHRARTGR